MAKYAHQLVLDNGLNHMKNNGQRVALIRAYLANANYATVTGHIVGAASTTSTDYTLADHGTLGRQITLAATTTTATASTGQTVISSATGGTATTLTDTTQTWAVNAHAGFRVSIASGTGAGQSRSILSNTADTLAVDADWTTTPDATSVYTVAANLHVVILDDTNSQVLYATDETSDQPITSGNVVNIPAFSYKLNQPV